MMLYITLQGLIWSTLSFYLIAIILEIAVCKPREKAWNPLMNGSCLDTNALNMAGGVLNIIFDFAILIFPMIPLWKLQVPLKRKFMTMAVFAIGIM